MAITLRLWISLNAALPFSQDGLHPVYNWRASLHCCHFLGQLFRLLGQVERDQELEQECSDETPAEPPPSPPQLQRAESVRKLSGHCQRRRTLNRQRGGGRPERDKRQEEREEREEGVLREASEKLETICSDFRASLRYKQVPGCEKAITSPTSSTSSTVSASSSSPSPPDDLRRRITIRSLEMISIQKKVNNQTL